MNASFDSSGLVAPERTLTRKQTAFIEYYCSVDVGMNGTEAARRSGYAGSNQVLAQVASENLRKPDVRAEIDRRLDHAAKAARLSISKVLHDIELTRMRAMEAGRWAVALKASELQGKYLQMWEGDAGASNTPLEEASTEELLAILKDILSRSHLGRRMREALEGFNDRLPVDANT